jgi:hypothetical protein
LRMIPDRTKLDFDSLPSTLAPFLSSRILSLRRTKQGEQPAGKQPWRAGGPVT